MSDYSDTSIVELAAIIATHLQERGIRVVLVGGLAVEIYSENIYPTKDINMIDISYQKPAALHQAMAAIGFTKQGRIFVSETTDITVEFPTAPITVGDETVTETTHVRNSAGTIPILKAGDVIKDRLAAYFHWQDKPSLVQALTLLARYTDELPSAETFCVTEGHPESAELMRLLLKSATNQNITHMRGFEKLVVNQTIENL